MINVGPSGSSPKTLAFHTPKLMPERIGAGYVPAA